MIKHKKQYARKGYGVEVRCGDTLIASSSFRFTNFSLSSCPECKMEVQTVGCSPETDKVEEFDYVN